MEVETDTEPATIRFVTYKPLSRYHADAGGETVSKPGARDSSVWKENLEHWVDFDIVMIDLA